MGTENELRQISIKNPWMCATQGLLPPNFVLKPGAMIPASSVDIIPMPTIDERDTCPKCGADLLVFAGYGRCPECKAVFTWSGSHWIFYAWRPQRTHGGFKIKGVR